MAQMDDIDDEGRGAGSRTGPSATDRWAEAHPL